MSTYKLGRKSIPLYCVLDTHLYAGICCNLSRTLSMCGSFRDSPMHQAKTGTQICAHIDILVHSWRIRSIECPELHSCLYRVELLPTTGSMCVASGHLALESRFGVRLSIEQPSKLYVQTILSLYNTIPLHSLINNSQRYDVTFHNRSLRNFVLPKSKDNSALKKSESSGCFYCLVFSSSA